jgi:hypothetical protein
MLIEVRTRCSAAKAQSLSCAGYLLDRPATGLIGLVHIGDHPTEVTPVVRDAGPSSLVEWYTATFPKRGSCISNTTQEFGMMLEPVIEPVFLGCESDQHARGATVPRDHDFSLGRQS